ncbi:unnamed protein product [Hymenolepis diminuta]|uniref:Uncharacterized protein n=1 Tax=Hymenolepis diminuta TaxID=6216 RepID=A0A564YKL2_HYMDI|nr:unnamed protein product [Hymenolepis diminuta]
MEETVIASISLEKDAYCILTDPMHCIPVTAAEIKHASVDNSVMRKPMTFLNTK